LLQETKRPSFFVKEKSAAVVATGWLGDTIACTAAATSLSEMGYAVTFFTRWPQLVGILRNDGRFKVVLYRYLRLKPLLKFILPFFYEKVIWEPDRWSYQEPFTSEIRRIAGCEPKPEYQLFLNNSVVSDAHIHPPSIAVSRDLYKRAYGRNVDDFIRQLEGIAKISWVGLPAKKNSKHGKNHDLLEDARTISESDIFVGPEGGLLWLAAGIGKPCIYFTENIVEVARQNGRASLDHVLGSKNYIINKSTQIPLPPYCDNQFAIATIQNFLTSKQFITSITNA
jgi:hypothetical protein